jgi:regulator of sigma E protease
MYIALAIVIFGTLIIAHEFGHFIAAKKLGVRVNEFAVGMGPKIFSWRRGETLYSVRLLLLLGGFCAMEGESALEQAGAGAEGEDGDGDGIPGEAWEAYIARQHERLDKSFAGQKLGAQRPTPGEIRGFLLGWARERADGGAMVPDETLPQPTEEEFHLWRHNKREREKLAKKEALDRAYKISMEMGDEERLRLYPRSFMAQKRWKRVVILAAGAAMNFLAGLVILLVLKMDVNVIVGTKLAGFLDGFPGAGESGLLAGDEILSVNGNRVYYADDVSFFLMLSENAEQTADLAVRRGGRKVRLDDFPLARRQYMVDGAYETRYGLIFEGSEPTFLSRLKYSVYTAFNYARIVRISLVRMVTGGASLRDMSGPVGIVSVINDVGSSPSLPTAGAKLAAVFEIAAIIAINLAVFNLLPVPALDGGRIFGIAVTFVIEKLIRRRVNPKYEGYIHAAGFAALMLFSAAVMIMDFTKLA